MPFLVVEVAVTQTDRSARKKAQEYILGSQGTIVFVVLIVVKRAPRPASRISNEESTTDDNTESQHTTDDRVSVNARNNIPVIQLPAHSVPQPCDDENLQMLRSNQSSSLSALGTSPSIPSTFQDQEACENDTNSCDANNLSLPASRDILHSSNTLRQGDTILVTVFKSMRYKTVDAMGNAFWERTGHCLIKSVEVFPHSSAATFPISLRDFVTDMPDNITPPLQIELRSLHDLAWTEITAAQSKVRADSSTGKAFVSSSIAGHDSESSEDASDSDHTMDPDFLPGQY